MGIRVAYIYFLPRLTDKEIELNSEYHASRKYRFLMSFLLVRDHEQLIHTFRGVGCWFYSCSSTIFHTCYIRMNLFSLKYISIYILVDV